jgi:hypothetical protein
VTIFVGDKRKKFVVHKKLLCESADYFKGAFTNDFEEARKGEMYMPEDSPGAFSLFVDWLYRSAIPMTNTEAHLHNLYDLYIFAEKLCLAELKDQTMDSIQKMATKFDLRDQLITGELLKKVLGETSEPIGGLKRFCLDVMIYVYLHRGYEHYLKELREKGVGISDINETGAEMCLTEKDLKIVWEIMKNDFDFFKDFQTRLTWELCNVSLGS